jgi:predicted nucleic acid-binding protein
VSGFLIDTNVVSEAVRRVPNPNVGQWFKSVPQSLLYLSVLTIGEIRRGITLQTSTARQVQLQAWLDQDVLKFFGSRILEVDIEVADRWGILTANARSAGKTLSSVDALLAATALHHNLTLVTRNTRDVTFTGVPLLNPWEP